MSIPSQYRQGPHFFCVLLFICDLFLGRQRPLTPKRSVDLEARAATRRPSCFFFLSILPMFFSNGCAFFIREPPSNKGLRRTTPPINSLLLSPTNTPIAYIPTLHPLVQQCSSVKGTTLIAITNSVLLFRRSSTSGVESYLLYSLCFGCECT